MGACMLCLPPFPSMLCSNKGSRQICRLAYLGKWAGGGAVPERHSLSTCRGNLSGHYSCAMPRAAFLCCSQAGCMPGSGWLGKQALTLAAVSSLMADLAGARTRRPYMLQCTSAPMFAAELRHAAALKQDPCAPDVGARTSRPSILPWTWAATSSSSTQSRWRSQDGRRSRSCTEATPLLGLARSRQRHLSTCRR